MAGARALWLANGMKREQFGKPIIAIANSFAECVPGHVHLAQVGRLIKAEIEKRGCFAWEFNTMAIDDGIAMGHDGMLYSLPSREHIADTIESMLMAHPADALICIGNCDKIGPGMLMAMLRLNIPATYVSGGPMEAGKGNIDLLHAMAAGADGALSAEKLQEIEDNACPTCGSCSGLFTANSMNCLAEALGLAPVGNGTLLATHAYRLELFKQAADIIVNMAYRYYRDGETAVLPRAIATHAAFANAFTVDMAMGGSTNTVLHLPAIANEGDIAFTLEEIERISKSTPTLCKIAPSSEYHVEDLHRAGGIIALMGELARGGLIDREVNHVVRYTSAHLVGNLGELIELGDIRTPTSAKARHYFRAAAGGERSVIAGSQRVVYDTLDLDRANGCIRDVEHAYSAQGGLSVLRGNIAPGGCIVKTAGVAPDMLRGEGRAIIFDSQEDACRGILDGTVKPGHAVIIRWEGPKGGPGMQEMLYPTTYLKQRGLDKKGCWLATDGRFSGGSAGPCIGHVSPEAAAGGLIGLLENGDRLSYDIPGGTITAHVSDEEFTRRKATWTGKPKRNRVVSAYLRKYAAFATSADRGAIQVVP